jgi:hypothetical protein
LVARRSRDSPERAEATGETGARAARRLGIHQNTVVYRVKQTEELLGHAIEQRRLPLEVALRLSDMIEGLGTAADGRRPARG